VESVLFGGKLGGLAAILQREGLQGEEEDE